MNIRHGDWVIDPVLMGLFWGFALIGIGTMAYFVWDLIHGEGTDA